MRKKNVSIKHNSLAERDLRHVWHPCSQMKDYEDFPMMQIASADGPYLVTTDGKKLIDAISSWWCKSLGHVHPRISAAVKKQMDRYEHVIMANTCCEPLVELSEKLANLAPGLDRVFYSDNGSTAVEVAIKMSLQYHAQTGAGNRTTFLALENGYHGETILTLAAGDCELYSSPYAPLMPKIPNITELPYVSGSNDADWNKISDDSWNKIESQLNQHSETLSGIIFEPILQGAGGMKIYSPDFLKRLRKWSTENGVHLIADEIMTGFGRTGKMQACEHAGIVPDFACLSKGLTGGFTPMAVTLTSTEIYNAFYDDYATGKAFMHSNTYCGYALGVAAALEALNIYDDENIIANVAEKSCELRRRMEYVASETNALVNIRSIGYMAAADLVDPRTGAKFAAKERTGYQCYKKAIQLGALLRPLGDTIYFLPPLNTPDAVLDDLAGIAADAIKSIIIKI
jgi:adenosylmethionine-8-amino-7-oxononanoate aminotransferase